MRFLTSALIVGASLLGMASLCQSAPVLDAEMVALSLLAMKLCLVIESQDLTGYEEGSTLFVDGSDAVLFYENEEYCFLACDTTSRYDIQDWMKNLDLGVSQIDYGDQPGEFCRTRNGYRRAYEEPSYRAALEQEVIDCHSRGKQVVLTGHSKGGATASVAGVALSHTDPYIITFGQPPSIVGDCPVVNPDKYYRFENTIINRGLGKHIDYDPVPQMKAQANHIGTVFILGEDTNNVVEYGDGATSPSIIKWGLDVDAHFSGGYIKRLESYQGKDLGYGWDTGFLCNLNEECKSGTCKGGWWFGTSGKCI